MLIVVSQLTSRLIISIKYFNEWSSREEASNGTTEVWRKRNSEEAKWEERRLNLTGVKLTLVGSPCIQYGDFLIESGWLLLRRSPDEEPSRGSI